MCIVKPDGPPQLCKTDEIGEIVINSRAGGTMYYGLPGVTKNTFEVCQSLKPMFCLCLFKLHLVEGVLGSALAFETLFKKILIY